MAITKIKTGSREEWLALRRNYIGGSDAAAVVGLSPFSSPYRVWAEKSGLIEGFGGNLATEVGSFLEEFVAGLFERETGKKVRRLNASIVNTAYPWAIADVDRVLVGTKEGLEIKTTSALATKKFKNGEFPTQYYCQCVHYLAVLGPEWKRWNLAVLIGNGDFRTYTIERDEDEIAALMKAEAELMEKIKNGTPPETHDGDGSVMDSVFACDADKSVDVSGISDLLEEYTRLKADIDDLEHRRSEIGTKIRGFLQDASSGESDRWSVSYRETTRSTFDRKAYEKDNGRIDAKYFKSTTSRPLYVNMKNEKENQE